MNGNSLLGKQERTVSRGDSPSEHGLPDLIDDPYREKAPHRE
jgi:hypothetical protein